MHVCEGSITRYDIGRIPICGGELFPHVARSKKLDFIIRFWSYK